MNSQKFVQVFQVEKVCRAYTGPTLNWVSINGGPLVLEGKGLTFSDAKAIVRQSKVHTVQIADLGNEGCTESQALVSICPEDFRLICEVVNPRLLEKMEECEKHNEFLQEQRCRLNNEWMDSVKDTQQKLYKTEKELSAANRVIGGFATAIKVLGCLLFTAVVCIALIVAPLL